MTIWDQCALIGRLSRITIIEHGNWLSGLDLIDRGSSPDIGSIKVHVHVYNI